MKAPRAAARPALRAPASPWLDCRITVSGNPRPAASRSQIGEAGPRRLVPRAVVDHDHLVRHPLRGPDALHRLGEQGAHLVAGDDDGEGLALRPEGAKLKSLGVSTPGCVRSSSSAAARPRSCGACPAIRPRSAAAVPSRSSRRASPRCAATTRRQSSRRARSISAPPASRTAASLAATRSGSGSPPSSTSGGGSSPGASPSAAAGESRTAEPRASSLQTSGRCSNRLGNSLRGSASPCGRFRHAHRPAAISSRTQPRDPQ